MEGGLVVYGVFRVYSNHQTIFLAAAKTPESAMKYCEENMLAHNTGNNPDPIYSTRATMHSD